MFLEDKISSILLEESVELDVVGNSALKTAMEIDDGEISTLLPKGSPAHFAGLHVSISLHGVRK